MSEASSLEAGLYVPGNRPEFPFPLQVVSTELFSPVVVAFPAKVKLVRKTGGYVIILKSRLATWRFPCHFT